MSLVLMVVLGIGVWPIAYGPIEPPTKRSTDTAGQRDAVFACVVSQAEAADPDAADPSAADCGFPGIKSLTERPKFS
jgi:hypothetical protein